MDDFPPIPSYDDLITPDQLAEELGVNKTYIMRARFIEPRLPYIRIRSANASILFSKAQVTWWMNQFQKDSMIKFDLLRDQARDNINERINKAGKRGLGRPPPIRTKKKG
jgi:hypothetical protein